MANQSAVGGSATSGGTNYESRAAAWLSVRILLEQNSPSLWKLPVSTTLDFIRCQTTASVDDILVGTSQSGFIYFQGKRKLSLSSSADSDFGSTLSQFTKQYLSAGDQDSPWNRPFNKELDRLILVTSSESSNNLKVEFEKVCRRAEELSPGQQLSEAAETDPQVTALQNAKSTITSTWQSVRGNTPSDDEIKSLLGSIHVQILDIFEGGAHEDAIKESLRSSILQTPTQDNLAWRGLVSRFLDLSSLRSGLNRRQLQDFLQSDGVDLNPTKSYQRDILKIKDYSSRGLKALSKHSEISNAHVSVKIDREVLPEVILTSEGTNLLVIGDPGTGKSGVMYDFVKKLDEQGRDFLLISADQIQSWDMANLKNEFGVENHILDILDNWPGRDSAFIIIDALDAVRSESNAQILKNFVAGIADRNDRWKLVSSIRRFDLRYSIEIQRCFPKTLDVNNSDPSFPNVQHINVDKLTQQELDQIETKSSNLFRLYNDSNDKLKELLKVPFNLLLMADLLNAGEEQSTLTPINSQSGILERYWMARVIRNDGLRDTRENLLKSICSSMVATSSLKIPRDLVSNITIGPTLDDLLRINIVREWQSSPYIQIDEYTLTFAHHILFDYTVARTILRPTSSSLEEKLSNNTSLTIFSRPSILMHLHYLWSLESNHEQFWKSCYDLSTSNDIAEITKIIGGIAASELIQTTEDLEFLKSSLQSDKSAVKHSAQRALKDIFGSLTANSLNPGELIQNRGDIWIPLLSELSEIQTVETIYPYRAFLFFLLGGADDATLEQKGMLGKASRGFLRFAFSDLNNNPNLNSQAIQCVCKTYSSDIAQSRNLLEHVFEPSRIQNYGHIEVMALTGEVDYIIETDPEFAVKIYEETFAFEEKSTEQIPMGNSNILPLQTNKKQNYEMSYYRLEESFKKLLEVDFLIATKACAWALNGYIHLKHRGSERETEAQLEIGSKSIKISFDFSSIWDDGEYEYDNAKKMVSEWCERLDQISKEERQDELVYQAVILFLEICPFACALRRIMRVACDNSKNLGCFISTILTNSEVLTNSDTEILAAMLLKEVHSSLEESKRDPIEKTILNFPESAKEELKKYFIQDQQRLLRVLNGENLVNESLKKLHSQLPTLEVEDFKLEERKRKVSWGRSDDDEITDLESTSPLKELNQLKKRISEFATKHSNNNYPTKEDTDQIMPTILKVEELLKDPENIRISEDEANRIETSLISACNEILRMEEFDPKSDYARTVKDIILKGTASSDRAPDVDSEERFDENSGYCSFVRCKAAEGVMLLSRFEEFCDSNLISIIEKLHQDPHPVVRYYIVSFLRCLQSMKPEKMFELIQKSVHSETNRGVITPLILRVLKPLRQKHQQLINENMHSIFRRVKVSKKIENARSFCIRYFVQSYIYEDDAFSKSIVDEIVKNIPQNPVDINGIPGLLRMPISLRNTEDEAPHQSEIRLRAIHLTKSILEKAIATMKSFSESKVGVNFNEWSEEEKEYAKTLGHIIDGIGNEIYFSSGAFAEKRGNDKEKEEETLALEQKKRFFLETEEIVDLLSTAGFAGVTHRLLEMLESFILADPKKIFLKIGKLIEGGQSGGYQFEQLAVDLMVELVERYLAEYRDLLQDEECQRTLINILSIFVEAGWPKARALTFQLEQIFR